MVLEINGPGQGTGEGEGGGAVVRIQGEQVNYCLGQVFFRVCCRRWIRQVKVAVS